VRGNNRRMETTAVKREEKIYGLLSRYYGVTYHKGLLQETNCGEKIQEIQTQKYLYSINPNNRTFCIFRPIKTIFREVIYKEIGV
jgi:hypothetical protein